jgi:dienelactone hydrolase
LCKKYLIITILLFGIFVQISFADHVKFESTSKGKDGKPVVLAGILTKPEGEGPFPAIVLLMHGCDGNRDTIKRDKAWVSRLVKWGYSTLEVDSLGPRGLSDFCNSWSLIETMVDKRAQDAYDTKSYLAELSFIDRDRIAAIGWAHGGSTIINITSRSIGDYVPFKAAIAFHPYCYKTLEQLNSPILILIGEKDTLCPADLCSKNMPSEKNEHETILKVYPGAHRDFDFDGIDENYGSHKTRYDPEAAEDAINQVKSFLAKYLK